MAKSGYVVFVVRAAPRMKPDEHKQVADVDGRGGDVLQAAASVSAKLAGAVLKNGRYQTAFRIDANLGQSRWMAIEALYGPYGSRGFLIDVLGQSADGNFGENQARALEYRAMLVVPTEGTAGLLFAERRGGTHLRHPFESELFSKVQRHLGVMLHVKAHVDRAAWDQFLRRGTVHEVTEVWESTRPEDYEADGRRAGQLKVALSGNAAARRGRGIITQVRESLAGERRSAINITLPEVNVSDADFTRRQMTINVDDGRARRTVVIDEGELPQWVYELEPDLGTGDLTKLWADHARSILSVYGTTLAENWQEEAAWRSDFLIPDIEVQ